MTKIADSRRKPLGGEQLVTKQQGKACMTLYEPEIIVQEALDTGHIEKGRSRLDAWQANQPVTLHTLNVLRYSRHELGQSQEAIVAVRAMIELRPVDACERISDHICLGKLYVGTKELSKAWDALNVVLNWPGLKAWYPFGLVRSAVELALDICAAAKSNQELSEKAFETAVALIDDGCSTSCSILKKAQDCAKRLGRNALHERFESAVHRDLRTLQRMLDT